MYVGLEGGGRGAGLGWAVSVNWATRLGWGTCQLQGHDKLLCWTEQLLGDRVELL